MVYERLSGEMGVSRFSEPGFHIDIAVKMYNKITGHLDKHKFLGKTSMPSAEESFVMWMFWYFFVTKSSNMIIRMI